MASGPGSREKLVAPMVALPVTCPRCGVTSMAAFPLPVVVIALTRWNNMALYADCCTRAWSASPTELQRLRDYLGAAWLDHHGTRAGQPSG